MHKGPSLTQLTLLPWRHISGAFSASLFSFVNFVFIRRSEPAFMAVGMSSKTSNIIRFYGESRATTGLSRANNGESCHLANIQRGTDTYWHPVGEVHVRTEGYTLLSAA